MSTLPSRPSFNRELPFDTKTRALHPQRMSVHERKPLPSSTTATFDRMKETVHRQIQRINDAAIRGTDLEEPLGALISVFSLDAFHVRKHTMDERDLERIVRVVSFRCAIT